jgi:probable F420-dependent oxidoreductase
MKIDAELGTIGLADVEDQARRLEQSGFDAVWTFEASHDPFLPLLSVARSTERLEFGTNISVAFGRSPFAMALVAWDLQDVSSGRFHLGLGTQVRAHVERRFSGKFEHPAARITDYIRCLRAIWDSYQTNDKPSYKGPYYQFTLINEAFNPGPISHPKIPIYLAGVNERMCRAAGEVADGFHVHPMHSTGYLRDVVRPAIDVGANTRGMTVDDLSLHASVFAILGDTAAEREKAEAIVRAQVAFYASTPSYRALLGYHGLEEVGPKLSQLMRQGDIAAMPALVPDSLMEAVTVTARHADLPALLRKRYDGLLQRVALYDPVPSHDPVARWAEFTTNFRRAA